MRSSSLALLVALTLPACADDGDATDPAPGSTGDVETTGTDDPETTDADDDSSGGDDSDGSSSGEPSGPGFEGLEGQLDALREEAGAPGMAVALVQGDEVVWTGGFGTRDMASGEPVTTDTPFRLGSISKTFVGVAMMRAQELGVVDLGDAIDVPFTVDNPHLDGESITYRDLAHHMSGIVDTLWYECAYTTEDGSAYAAPQDQAYCPEAPMPGLDEFLGAYLDPEGSMYTNANYASGADGEPGTTYEYSNVGAGLASAALSHATEDALGQDFIAFSNAEVFGPLGLEHTRWMRDELPEPDAAAVPHIYEDGFVPVPRYNLSTFADGALYSSVDDLAHYLAAIVPGRGGDVLEPASADALIDFVDVDDGDVVNGQGIFWERYLGLIGHTGADPGVATAIGYDPDAELGYVILLNSTGPGTDTLMLQVMGTLQAFAAESL